MRQRRVLDFTRGLKHTGVVLLGGRLTILVVWSLFWWRHRGCWPLVTYDHKGGASILRVGPVMVNWLVGDFVRRWPRGV